MFCRLALFAFVTVAVSGLEAHNKPHPMDGKRQAGMKELVVIDDKNYFFVQDNMNWYDAQLTCNGMGMQMLELDNQTKSDMMLQWLLSNPFHDGWTWIGLRRGIGMKTFLWESSGAELTYANWGTNQPSDPQGYATCGDIAGFYRAWEVVNCGVFLFSVICEEVAA